MALTVVMDTVYTSRGHRIKDKMEWCYIQSSLTVVTGWGASCLPEPSTVIPVVTKLFLVATQSVPEHHWLGQIGKN